MEERQDGHCTELQNHEKNGDIARFYPGGTGITPQAHFQLARDFAITVYFHSGKVSNK